MKHLLFGLLTTMVTVGAAVSGMRAQSVPQMVKQHIDEQNTVELRGNVRPEAKNSANDHGRVADSLMLEHMQLLLKRPVETEAALEQYINALQDPTSSNFHKWLTAEQFGATFGPSSADRQAVIDWLISHGFVVNSVAAGGMTIDFSGTASQVRKAFHTEIHNLLVNSKNHIANTSEPQIPTALTPVVRGVVSLHDFHPHTYLKPRANYTYTNQGSIYEAVVPADLATIYNFNPLFNAGISGQGQTIAVIEDTNVYSNADWSKFRSTFGLSRYSSGSLTQVHPAPSRGTNNCSNPGVTADESEATLDAEWASAAAPSAAIQVVSCNNTRTTTGVLIALQNLLNSPNPPKIVSISYGECEASNGATANAAYNSAYQQAAAEGVSVFVAAGDEGAASCDANLSRATHGIGVSGFASTPYNVAVGGTDFGDTYAGTTSTYWNTSNTSTDGSAKSYIPEIPWNDSCASQLLAVTLPPMVQAAFVTA